VQLNIVEGRKSRKPVELGSFLSPQTPPSTTDGAMVDDAVKIYERRSIERGRKQPSTIEATPTAIHINEISS
jgi:hypothetical protein